MREWLLIGGPADGLKILVAETAWSVNINTGAGYDYRPVKDCTYTGYHFYHRDKFFCVGLFGPVDCSYKVLDRVAQMIDDKDLQPSPNYLATSPRTLPRLKEILR